MSGSGGSAGRNGKIEIEKEKIIAKRRRIKRGSHCRGNHKIGWLSEDGYGPYGKPRKATSPFTRVRLKRHYKKRDGFNYPISFEIQKKDASDRWISMGFFRTENEALEILEDEVEIMRLCEALKEQVDANDGKGYEFDGAGEGQ